MKVGDIVRIHDIDKCKFGCGEGMLKYEGKIAKVIKIYEEWTYDDGGEGWEAAYKLNIDKGRYIYSNNVLKSVGIIENE